MNEYLYLKVSHSEKQLAEQLTDKLEKAGHKVWLGLGSGSGADSGGDQQLRQIQFAIERSDAFLLGLSPELLAKADAGKELALAKEAGKPIFLVQLRSVDLTAEWETELADRPIVDLSDDFDAGLAALLSSLASAEAAEVDVDRSGNFFGGEHFGRVPALTGEQIVWSESGFYWFKNWKTLVRVLVILTDRRLHFFWDSRDIWKWKLREADELEEAFPMTLSLDHITAVGEVNKPKSFLIFATGRPYVEIMTAGNQLQRFSLESDFETRIDALRDAVTG